MMAKVASYEEIRTLWASTYAVSWRTVAVQLCIRREVCETGHKEYLEKMLLVKYYYGHESSRLFNNNFKQFLQIMITCTAPRVYNLKIKFC
jgi:hypothetical protein